MSAYRKSPSFVARSVAGEMLLVPIARARADLNAVLVLEGIGGRVWELLEAVDSEDELIDTIVEECDVDRETATQDLRSFLGDLREAGALLDSEVPADAQSSPEGPGPS